MKKSGTVKQYGALREPPGSVLSALNLRFFEHIATEEYQKKQEECKYQHRINFFGGTNVCRSDWYYKNEAKHILVCQSACF